MEHQKLKKSPCLKIVYCCICVLVFSISCFFSYEYVLGKLSEEHVSDYIIQTVKLATKNIRWSERTMSEPREIFDKGWLLDTCGADASSNKNIDVSELIDNSSVLNYLLMDISDKNEWKYYSETAVLPTPDSCISEIEYSSKVGNTYLYIVDDANNANSYSYYFHSSWHYEYYYYYAYMLVVIDGYDVFDVVNNNGENYSVYYNSEYIATFAYWYDKLSEKTYLAVTPKRVEVAPVEDAVNEMEPIIDFLLECYNNYAIDSSAWEYFEENDVLPTPESCVKDLVKNVYEDTGFYGLYENSEVLFLTYQIVLVKGCNFRFVSECILGPDYLGCYTYSPERNTLYMVIQQS